MLATLYSFSAIILLESDRTLQKKEEKKSTTGAILAEEESVAFHTHTHTNTRTHTPQSHNPVVTVVH